MLPTPMLRPEKMVPATAGLAESVWGELYPIAEAAAEQEPKLMGILDDVVLSRNSLCNAVAVRLARKLSRRDMGRDE
ncbi:MAG: serine O-acetyltransferase, partial [Akkermansia sp.]|nr:serine O-acetyltransferase [Akkermansia sp.]